MTLLIAGHDTTAGALAWALHQLELPLVFADDGSAVQASPEPERPFTYPSSCFVTGTIHGTSVPCSSAEQQVYFHQGYEPSERDRHDMAQLRRLNLWIARWLVMGSDLVLCVADMSVTGYAGRWPRSRTTRSARLPWNCCGALLR